jgi:hypothetical protein
MAPAARRGVQATAPQRAAGDATAPTAPARPDGASQAATPSAPAPTVDGGGASASEA